MQGNIINFDDIPLIHAIVQIIFSNGMNSCLSAFPFRILRAAGVSYLNAGFDKLLDALGKIPMLIF